MCDTNTLQVLYWKMWCDSNTKCIRNYLAFTEHNDLELKTNITRTLAENFVISLSLKEALL